MLVQPCERMCGVTVLRNCATTSIPYGRDTWRSLSHTNEHHQMYRRERTKLKKKKQKHKLRVWCTHHLHTDRSRRTDDCAILKHQYMHNWFNAAKSLAIITSSWIDFKRFRLIMNFFAGVSSPSNRTSSAFKAFFFSLRSYYLSSSLLLLLLLWASHYNIFTVRW